MEIKRKKHSVNATICGLANVTSSDHATTIAGLSTAKERVKLKKSFQENQREIEIYVENQHLVKKIANINRRMKPVNILLQVYVIGCIYNDQTKRMS